LELQVEKLSNQVRFVQMIVKKELVVSNRKKADIVAELRKKDFKSIPKVVKKKGAAESTEVAAEGDEEDEDIGAENSNSVVSNGFDYLLGMAIWSLTQEKVRSFFYSIHFG
jgi:DNA topoisomerase II